MFDKSLSFSAGMNIRNHPVTLIDTLAGISRMGTQVQKTTQLRFGFYYSNGGYSIKVLEGPRKGKWIKPRGDGGYLETSDSPVNFKLTSTNKAVRTLKDMPTDVQTIYLQAPSGWYVQQQMEGLTAFDDLDVLYNFMLAVPKTDRKGNGTYLAMIEDEWVTKPIGFNVQPAFINVHIIERGID